jgi:hypothetical protein
VRRGAAEKRAIPKRDNSTGFEQHNRVVAFPVLSRKILKQRRRHARSKFLEQPHWPRHVAVAEMDKRKVLGAEAPLRHDFDEPPIANQFG